VTMNDHPVVLLGMGGHARVLLDVMCGLRMNVIGFVDHSPKDNVLNGIHYLGNDEEFLSNFSPEKTCLVNGLGGVADTNARKEIFERYKSHGYNFISVIHPSAIIAQDVVLGEGCQLMAGVIIQPGVECGNNVLINTRACVDHDCVIGAHSHISIGSVLSGAIVVGEGAHLGAGCAIIQNVNIGANSTVGAGSVVVNAVAAGQTVVGVPARRLIK